MYFVFQHTYKIRLEYDSSIFRNSIFVIDRSACYSTGQEENQIPPISEFLSREDRKYILRDRRNIAKTRQSSAINSQISADFLLQISRRIGELLLRIV